MAKKQHRQKKNLHVLHPQKHHGTKETPKKTRTRTRAQNLECVKIEINKHDGLKNEHRPKNITATKNLTRFDTQKTQRKQNKHHGRTKKLNKKQERERALKI